jgi:hypothetical protein
MLARSRAALTGTQLSPSFAAQDISAPRLQWAQEFAQPLTGSVSQITDRDRHWTRHRGVSSAVQGSWVAGEPQLANRAQPLRSQFATGYTAGAMMIENGYSMR